MQSLKLISFVVLALLMTACNSGYQPTQTVDLVFGKSAKTIGITEQTAFEWLLIALKQHKVANLDCLNFRGESNENNDIAEDDVASVWDFAAIEVHDTICRGDPNIAHVRDRYQIYSDGSVMVYDARNADYKPL